MQIKEDERLDDLQINGLRLIQKTTGFKFGIDAVLLSDFAKHQKASRALDLCTGTGIIPLLLSAKTTIAQLYGIEIQEDIADMAQRSVQYNHLSERIHITRGDLRANTYPKKSFDMVTCNPPYMKHGSALPNRTDTKLIARHEICCTLDDVIHTAASLLRPGGHFFMVHRPSRLVDIFCTMRLYRLEPKRIRFIHPQAEKAANLVLIEGLEGGGTELKLMPPLSVFHADGTYTEEINRIYERNSI